MFMSFREIVEDLLVPGKFDPRALEEFRITPIEDLIKFHHSLGTWIRNNYKLWDADNLLTHSNQHAWVIGGRDYNPLHPDAVSMIIMRAFHRQLNSRRL